MLIIAWFSYDIFEIVVIIFKSFACKILKLTLFCLFNHCYTRFIINLLKSKIQTSYQINYVTCT